MWEDHRDYGSYNGVNFKSGKGMLKVCIKKSVHERGKRVVWGRGFGFDKHSYAEVKILFGNEEQKGGIKYYDRFPVCVFRYN